MPRLTNPDYLDTHHKLRRLWLHDPNLYSELTPNEQWSLHDFFVPDLDWSDEKLIERRQAMGKIHPSLPQKAGRALGKFWGTTATRSLKQVQAAKAPATKTQRRLQEDRRLGVRALARPEPDVKLLAKAFMGLALQRAKEQNGRLGPSGLRDAHDDVPADTAIDSKVSNDSV